MPKMRWSRRRCTWVVVVLVLLATGGARATCVDGEPCNDLNPCTIDDVCQAGTCLGTPAPERCENGHLCYRARDRGDFGARPGVSLSDFFENGPAAVERPAAICPPADAASGGSVEPGLDLLSYAIESSAVRPNVGNVVVADRFGTLEVNVYRTDRVLALAATAFGNPPPGVPNSLAANEYKCYRVKIARGTRRFPRGMTVTVTDRFQSRVYEVGRPLRLCNPVSIASRAQPHTTAHLMCYQV